MRGFSSPPEMMDFKRNSNEVLHYDSYLTRIVDTLSFTNTHTHSSKLFDLALKPQRAANPSKLHSFSLFIRG